MANNNDDPGDLRRFCEFGGLAGPVARRIRTCLKCGEEYEDSVGSDSGICQDCWEEYCADEWFKLWEKRNDKI